MLLHEIASFLNIADGNQLALEQKLLIMDTVQKSAFERDLDAFLVYDREVDTLTELLLGGVSVAPTDASIGATVTGSISGATGVLRSYDDELRSWRVKTTGTFTPGEAVTGGGASGTLATADHQRPWRGPYTAPAHCRKIWGITRRTPGRFYGGNARMADDYGETRVDRPFVGGQVNDLDRTFLFGSPPNLAHTLYWVFWRAAPSITGIKDQSQLLIPAAYHLPFIACCNAAAKMILVDGRFDGMLVHQYLGDWLASLSAPYRDQEDWQNMTRQVGDGFV